MKLWVFVATQNLEGPKNYWPILTKTTYYEWKRSSTGKKSSRRKFVATHSGKQLLIWIGSNQYNQQHLTSSGSVLPPMVLIQSEKKWAGKCLCNLDKVMYSSFHHMVISILLLIITFCKTTCNTIINSPLHIFDDHMTFFIKTKIRDDYVPDW